MMRRVSGWSMMVTAFFLCPCHLFVIALLVAPFLAGTALESFVMHQAVLVYTCATVLFTLFLVIGNRLVRVPTCTNEHCG